MEKIRNLRDEIAENNSLSLSVDVAFQCVSILESFTNVSCDEVKTVMIKSPSKSCSLDPFPTTLLKQVLDPLLPAISKIVNTSLLSGIFPDLYKLSLTLPIIKKPSLDPEVLENYRPIANLHFISKILEKLVSSQIRNYLGSNKLYPSYQSAYRTFSSTETALITITNDINLALDKGDEVILVNVGPFCSV